MMIQERDKQILRRCYEQQFLLMEHVERYFFKGADSTNARQRIRELEGAGWLRKESIAGLSRRQVIRPTAEGGRLARGLGAADITERPRLDLNTLEHDAQVTSVALRLAELWDGTWIPERAVDSGEFPHVPDGAFVFPGGKRVPVEVENSLKGRRRFMAILDRWRRTPVLAVLYVATTPEIRDGLEAFISEGPRGVPFALVLWEELRTGVPFAWSARGELDLFRRRTL